MGNDVQKYFHYVGMDRHGCRCGSTVLADSVSEASRYVNRLELRDLFVFCVSECESEIHDAVPNRLRYWLWRAKHRAAIVFCEWGGLIGLVVICVLCLFAWQVTNESPMYQQELHAAWQRTHGRVIPFEDWRRLRREHLLPGQSEPDTTIVPVFIPTSTGK